MNRDPSLPPEPLMLTDASAQEIQLELIRRRRFNQFDGPKIVGNLRRHRKLWRAVLMDRARAKSDSGPEVFSLIPLRDLPRNDWNVDLLYILCDTVADAEQLRQIAADEEWEPDSVELYTDEKQVGMALGHSPPKDGTTIVEMWWD
jgi:hypothetical protein